MPPFGSPKRGRVARPNDAKRRRRRVVQVDPPHGGTDARFPRQGRWRGSVAAPASWVHGRPGIAGLHPTGGRASRGPLNGFPGALAGVLRHRIGGGRRRLSETSATGLSDAAKAGEPAYPLGPRFAGPRQWLAGGAPPPSIPRRPALGRRSRAAGSPAYAPPGPPRPRQPRSSASAPGRSRASARTSTRSPAGPALVSRPSILTRWRHDLPHSIPLGRGIIYLFTFYEPSSCYKGYRNYTEGLAYAARAAVLKTVDPPGLAGSNHVPSV